MERSIWKFVLTPKEITEVIMPIGAEILCVQAQRNDICLWAVVDTEAEKEVRTFTILGTGHDFTKHPGEYVGTFQLDNGSLVFHLFEK